MHTERAADGALATRATVPATAWGEASALNIRWRQHVDLAKRLRGLHQVARRLLGRSGHVSGQAAIYNNLALAYRALGLYRHSNRMAHHAIEIRRRLHDFDGAGNALTIVGGNDTLVGNAASARRHYADLEAIYDQRGVNAIWNLRFVWLAALIAIAERDGAAAVPLLEEALPLTASAEGASSQY